MEYTHVLDTSMDSGDLVITLNQNKIMAFS